MSTDAEKAVLRETCSVFAVVAGVTWLLRRLEDVLPLVRDNLHLLVGALFLVTAIRCAERLPGGLGRYGLTLGGLLAPDPGEAADGLLAWAVDLFRALFRATPLFLRELGVALLLCALVFPPFIVAFHVWHAPAHAFSFVPQRDFLAYLATQVLVVALPEEALFRGYLQGRLHDGMPARRQWGGASFSPAALVSQALLFALLHFIVDLEVVRLAVFFPALLFGWLAARRGGIGAAIFVHAFSNLLSDVLVRGWL
jgi:hypothetical protein